MSYNTVVNVATTSTPVVANQPDRQAVYLHNNSDTTIYLNYGGEDATVAGGFALGAGDRWIDDTHNGPITAIHNGTGTKELRVVEVLG